MLKCSVYRLFYAKITQQTLDYCFIFLIFSIFSLFPLLRKRCMAEGFLGGCVSEVASILGVCEQSQKHAQHQNHQLDDFYSPSLPQQKVVWLRKFWAS